MRGFGDLEAAIMDVVWTTDDPLPVRDVWTTLNDDRPLAYTTVQTVMENLYRKGWLARDKPGRAYRYWATHTRDDYAASLLSQVLETSSNKTGALVKLFEQMDPSELTELRAALNKRKSQRDRR